MKSERTECGVSPGGKKLILIVDDDPNTIKLVSARLTANNYSVISAANGIEAVEMANRYRPDLIILDYKMSNGDGTYVLGKLRTALETFSIPVIFLTAYPQEAIEPSFWLSAYYVLAKPFIPEVLLRIVKSALRE